MGGGAGLPPNFFLLALRASVWHRNKGGPGPPGPFPGPATAKALKIEFEPPITWFYFLGIIKLTIKL